MTRSLMNHIHISTSKSNRRKARGEVQLYNTSKQKKEKTQEVADKLDHGVFKKVVVVCVLLYIIIELFSVIAIWHFADTSVLTTLISETSEVLRMGVFGYMIKAGIENWQKIKKRKAGK